MKKKHNFSFCIILVITVFNFLLVSEGFSQEKINYRIFSIGNTANLKEDTTFYYALKETLSKSNEKKILLINGDLIKSDAHLSRDSSRVYKMLHILSSAKNTQIIVLPGDRDWSNSGKNGLKTVKKVEKWVENDVFNNVKWVLDKGCPGPEIIELDSMLNLMLINTQWWNHPYEKPTTVDAECPIITKKDFVIEFENALAETEEKNLIIAGHFSLIESPSPSFENYLTPFPILGSFKSAFHQNIGGKQDVVNERFNKIRKTMLSRMSVKSGVIYLSANDFNIQINKENENYFINSGLPTNSNKATRSKLAIYSSKKPGITELVYYENGKVATTIYAFDEEKLHFKKEIILYKTLIDSTSENKNLPSNYANKSCLKDVSSTSFPQNEATAMAVAGNYQASWMKKLIMGEHYRTSWLQPVEIPILNMDTTKGGLVAYDRGGGHQTTSVKMYGNDGKAYTFRSVNKDATRDLGAELKQTIIARQLQDNVSMQQPYGSLVVGKLLDNTTILHAQPQLFVLPQSDKLGVFNKYNGLFGTLEDHAKNPKKTEKSFADANKIVQSHQLNQKLYNNFEHKLIAEEYAKARVFDILVGDHGKHQDNWKWAGYKTDTGYYYRPIPRDRDLVFVKWDGIIPYLSDRKWALEAGENFGYKINDVKSLMFVATHPDRFLTNELDREKWLTAAKYIQTQLTDEKIEEAVKTMPKEIYELSGKEIEQKLKARIKALDKYALKYYLLLAKQVDVVGTNEKNYFEVIRNENKTVEVTIFNIINDSLKGTKQFYHRVFLPTETKEIRLYGLGGKDVFTISGNTKSSIKIIVVGGDGADIISDNSSVTTIGKQTNVYEDSKKATLNLGKEAKQINTWNKDAYDFQPTAFEYNRYMPAFSLGYNANNGFQIGGGVSFTLKEKYGKQDFASKHSFSIATSTEDNNIFKYKGRWHHIIQKWDVQGGLLLANHNNLVNFFGVGNNTEKIDSLNAIDFYKTTYNSYEANLGLVRDFWKKSSVSFGVEYQKNEAQISQNTILFSDASNNTFGKNNTNILISAAEIDIDFRDKSDLPEKGIRAFVNYKNGVLTNSDGSYNIASGFLEHYFSVYLPSPITLGLKIGGSLSEGEIPFYNLVYLGQKSNLRGYKNNRFTGKSTVFTNAELRIQLAKFNSGFVPMKLGIKGFFDAGRVFSDFDTSDKWHNAVGGGFYWVFLDEQFTLNISVAHSEEESNLILFSLGKAFN